MLETAAELASRIALYQTTAFAPRILFPFDSKLRPLEESRRICDALENLGTEALYQRSGASATALDQFLVEIYTNMHNPLP